MTKVIQRGLRAILAACILMSISTLSAQVKFSTSLNGPWQSELQIRQSLGANSSEIFQKSGDAKPFSLGKKSGLSTSWGEKLSREIDFQRLALSSRLEGSTSNVHTVSHLIKVDGEIFQVQYPLQPGVAPKAFKRNGESWIEMEAEFRSMPDETLESADRSVEQGLYLSVRLPNRMEYAFPIREVSERGVEHSIGIFKRTSGKGQFSEVKGAYWLTTQELSLALFKRVDSSASDFVARLKSFSAKSPGANFYDLLRDSYAFTGAPEYPTIVAELNSIRSTQYTPNSPQSKYFDSVFLPNSNRVIRALSGLHFVTSEHAGLCQRMVASAGKRVQR